MISAAPVEPRFRPSRRLARWAAIGLVAAAALTAGGVFYVRSIVDEIATTLPATPDIATLPVSTAVVDRAGLLLRPFTTSDGRWRLPVTVDEVDRRFIDMLIAYEDQNFERHGGIEWSAMLRAAGQYVGAGRIVSGGSTLTMQVARLVDQQPTRNLWGKVRQMVHADVLEHRLTKEDILTLYLTLAPYGGNIEGIRAASLAYFGKEPTRLTSAEAALLVALPQSPEARRPDRDPAAALAGRNKVLDRMVAKGVITADEADGARREPIPTARHQFPMLAAHLAQSAITAQPNARRIALTVDRQIQSALERLGASRARQLGPHLSVAIVVADQATGNILASVGSAGLFARQSDGFVDMTNAVRSPGSTLKPLIYGLGFELGLAHPESLIEDRPTAFNGYVPVNFDGYNRGTVTIRQALTESLNVPVVIVLDAVGTARLMSRLKRANVDPKLPGNTAPGLAIGLGGVGVTLRDLVSIYTAIARGGSPVRLNDGVSVRSPAMGEVAPVLDPVAAWYVSDILADVPPPLNGSPGRIAYKTGTSYGYRDAWAIGYDGKTVIGVWVGRPDGVPVPGISGIVAAAPILFESFDRLGAPTVRLRPAPAGAIVASNSQLPSPLRRFRHPDLQMVARDAAPEIAFPADGVDVDLGAAGGSERPLMVKVRNGVPPFTFFANGAPFARSAFARQNSWTPDGPGYVTLSVLDAEGRSDMVTVFID
ncbi:penicillin-binding protein 1C [Devosia limi]|uniref:peptidoglycan glycosyltransferase n=1 Tax=Devosia limi DSM 17137 TaxID=1121477 RepID=A0A1M4U466_9HYPH|nr:penicillin-binding protein 1C [Devosia limi]SHE51529.1 penicillin-binding protein 1C [Devosia limi DSM 17137]